MLHLQIYYSMKQLPSVIFLKSKQINPLGRWQIKRNDILNSYWASFDYNNGSHGSIKYCKKTTDNILNGKHETINKKNYDDWFYELLLNEHKL